MSNTKKYLLLAATVWPIIYMVLFMTLIPATFFLSANNNSTPFNFFYILLPLHFFTMIEMMALIAIYIYDVFKGNRVKKDDRPLWAIIIFVGSNIGMFVYWYMFIWKKPQKALAKHAAK